MSEQIRLKPDGQSVPSRSPSPSDSAQHIVFWEDIQELFPGASSVLHGTVPVSRARDASFRL